MKKETYKKHKKRKYFNEKISSSLAILKKYNAEESVAPQYINQAVDEGDALRENLDSFKGSEAAILLEMLPDDQRTLVWDHLDDKVASQAIVEVVDDAARQLIRNTNSERVDNILSHMGPSQLINISDVLPPKSVEQAKQTLNIQEQDWLDANLTFPAESVGNLMSAEYLTFDVAQTVEHASNAMRKLSDLPKQSDKIFIVNDKKQLEGVVTLVQLLRHNGDETLGNIMDVTPISFRAEDKSEDVSLSFERNDLISAPVINEDRIVIGRLTVESVMDFIREKTEQTALAKEGLNADSDLFGPIWFSAKKRWLWLSINLFTAFVASRFIGLFEDSIAQLVALATLMPIVASVGGNTGNQTIALLIRGLSLKQIHKENLKFLFIKELSISFINGLLWGSVLGLFAYFLYGNAVLGLVLMVATMLNLLVAAFVGMVVPVSLDKLGKDPAMGSSVILTFITDSMGFFIFLSLATIFLL